jgi:hypothetical protein
MGQASVPEQRLYGVLATYPLTRKIKSSQVGRILDQVLQAGVSMQAM